MANSLDPWFIDGESGFHLDLTSDPERKCPDCDTYLQTEECEDCLYMRWETTVEAAHHRERERLGEGRSREYLDVSQELADS